MSELVRTDLVERIEQLITEAKNVLSLLSIRQWFIPIMK